MTSQESRTTETRDAEDSPSPTDIDVEVLGRQRPAVFGSWLSEVGFCSSLLGLMLMGEYLVGGFHIILPQLASDLNIPSESQTWPSSVFSLVAGACLLPFGRVSEKFGGYITFNIGLGWFFLWTLLSGFSHNYVMLIACRAMAGLGVSAVLPAGMMMLGKTYRPGPRKNLVFALYGSFAPIGFFFGIFIGGLTGQYLSWRWYFWVGSMILGVLIAISFFSIPKDYGNKHEVQMDWLGTVTIVPGLALLIYALTDSSQAPEGWKSPQILVTLIVGVLLLAIGFYIEKCVASSPLLPPDLFSTKYIKTLMLALWLTYGVFGLFLFYSSFYIERVLRASPLLTAAWYVPLAAGGVTIGLVGGFTLHLLPGRLLLILSGCGSIVCVLLFAIMPEDPSYWAYVFPSMVCATIGIDIAFTVSNVYITTSLPQHHQGLAGALINSLLFLGISFWLGMADIAVHQTSDSGLRSSYKSAFWVGVGAASAAASLFSTVRIGSASSDLTVEEKRQREAAGQTTLEDHRR
ncbi:Drug resistance protein [Colletotrichum siamense]|nr:Drug resistance protein [Colletotrichum siamense]